MNRSMIDALAQYNELCRVHGSEHVLMASVAKSRGIFLQLFGKGTPLTNTFHFYSTTSQCTLTEQYISDLYFNRYILVSEYGAR